MLKNIHKILKIITGITLFIFIAIIAFKAIIYNITFPYKLHFNINREQFKELLDEKKGATEIAKEMGISRAMVYKLKDELNE